MLYPNLSTAMSEKKITKTDISNLLGIHFNTVTAKLDGETTSNKGNYQIGFTAIEAIVLKNTFFKAYDLAWLFEFNIEQSA